MYLADVTIGIVGEGIVRRGNMRFEIPHVQLSWGLRFLRLLRVELCRRREGGGIVAGWHGGGGFVDIRESMGKVNKVVRRCPRQCGHPL